MGLPIYGVRFSGIAGRAKILHLAAHGAQGTRGSRQIGSAPRPRGRHRSRRRANHGRHSALLQRGQDDRAGGRGFQALSALRRHLRLRQQFERRHGRGGAAGRRGRAPRGDAGERLRRAPRSLKSRPMSWSLPMATEPTMPPQPPTFSACGSSIWWSARASRLSKPPIRYEGKDPNTLPYFDSSFWAAEEMPWPTVRNDPPIVKFWLGDEDVMNR